METFLKVFMMGSAPAMIAAGALADQTGGVAPATAAASQPATNPATQPATQPAAPREVPRMIAGKRG